MTKLVLCSLIEGVYSDKIARAYIYYGTADEPRDHENKPLGTFMPSEDRDSLEKHLTEVVMPKIQAGLSSSPYQVLFIDYLNNAPHPHLVIARKDKGIIDQAERDSIKRHLISAINQINKPHKAPAPVSDSSLFSAGKKSRSADPAAKKSHSTGEHKQTRYNLRPR